MTAARDVADAIVCGGGPAGLAAATWLGRYRRKTVVLDEGRQRNLSVRSTHGYLTRDGASPQEILQTARRDLERYETVDVLATRAGSVARDGHLFRVKSDEGELRSHRVVLATGVDDVWPEIKGLPELYGISVFHCACCDGYEARDQDVLAIGWGEHTAGFALDLLDWGARVTLVTNGNDYEGDESCRAALARHEVEVIEEHVASFRTERDRMTGVTLESGRDVDATLAFFSIAHRPRSGLARELGCDLDGEGYVKTDGHGATSVAGVYAAGDVAPGEQLIQAAAAQGAIAGIACAQSLRGMASASDAPQPGPDPEAELG